LMGLMPQLLELQASPAFRLYLELLRAGQIQLREEGFKSGPDTFEYYKGQIEGIGQAREMVSMLVARGNDIVKREEAGARPKPAARLQRDEGSDTSF